MLVGLLLWLLVGLLLWLLLIGLLGRLLLIGLLRRLLIWRLLVLRRWLLGLRRLLLLLVGWLGWLLIGRLRLRLRRLIVGELLLLGRLLHRCLIRVGAIPEADYESFHRHDPILQHILGNSAKESGDTHFPGINARKNRELNKCLKIDCVRAVLDGKILRACKHTDALFPHHQAFVVDQAEPLLEHKLANPLRVRFRRPRSLHSILIPRHVHVPLEIVIVPLLYLNDLIFAIAGLIDCRAYKLSTPLKFCKDIELWYSIEAC